MPLTSIWSTSTRIPAPRWRPTSAPSWPPIPTGTFTPADAGRLLADKNLFARKFDASVDDEILGVLERDRDARLAPTLAEVA